MRAGAAEFIDQFPASILRHARNVKGTLKRRAGAAVHLGPQHRLMRQQMRLNHVAPGIVTRIFDPGSDCRHRPQDQRRQM